MKRKFSGIAGMLAILLTFGLVLAGCSEPSNPTPAPTPGFSRAITSAEEWAQAMADIGNSVKGTYENYETVTLTINDTIELEGITSGNSWNRNEGNGNYITLELKGNGTLKLKSNGRLIQISGATNLIIDGPILQGKTGNNAALVGAASMELKSGKITGNENNSSSGGGGVYAWDFTMSGGEISGNSVLDAHGGGVYAWGSFTMSGGTITDNSANWGGGVYMMGTGTFTKTGGVIHGDTQPHIIGITHTAGSQTNTATGTSGHAVYWSDSSGNSHYRNTTLGANDNLSSADFTRGWDQ